MQKGQVEARMQNVYLLLKTVDMSSKISSLFDLKSLYDNMTHFKPFQVHGAVIKNKLLRNEYNKVEIALA